MRGLAQLAVALAATAVASSREHQPSAKEELALPLEIFEEIFHSSDEAGQNGRRRLQADEFRGSKQELGAIDPVRLGIASAIILGLGSLAAGAGVGGGGLFVPTYWLILGVGPKGAVPLSGATILGAAFGNFVTLGWQKHPRANRPLIDYEVATFTQPGELLGVVFGVLLNIVLPPVAIIVFLAAILSYNARRTVRKGFTARRKETAARNRKNAALAEADREEQERTDDDKLPTPAKDPDEEEGHLETSPLSPRGSDAVANAGSDFFAATPPSECKEESTNSNTIELTTSGQHLSPRAASQLSPRAAAAVTTPEHANDVDPKMVVAHSETNLEAVENESNNLSTIAIGRSHTEEAAGIVPGRSVDDEPNPELAAVLAMDAVQFPLWAYGLLFPMTAYLFVYRYMSRQVFTPCATWDLSERGGEPRGWAGGVYWLWYWTPVPVFASFMYGCGEILKERTRRRARCPGYVALETDIQWDNKFLSKFPGYALGAGVAAGLLGIGGGMIQGPIFLEIGMEPKCATSATAFSILWTASSSTILWYVSGNIHWQLMVWVFCFGFVSGQIGQHGIDKVIKETGRPSYVIFLLGGIIGTACVAMVVSGAVTIILDVVSETPIFFLNLKEFKCGVPDV